MFPSCPAWKSSRSWASPKPSCFRRRASKSKLHLLNRKLLRNLSPSRLIEKIEIDKLLCAQRGGHLKQKVVIPTEDFSPSGGTCFFETREKAGSSTRG